MDRARRSTCGIGLWIDVRKRYHTNTSPRVDHPCDRHRLAVWESSPDMGAWQPPINARVRPTFAPRVSSASSRAFSSSTDVDGDTVGAVDFRSLWAHGRGNGSTPAAMAQNDSTWPGACAGSFHLQHCDPFGPSPLGTRESRHLSDALGFSVYFRTSCGTLQDTRSSAGRHDTVSRYE